MRIDGTNNFLSEIRKSPLTQLIGTEAQIHVAQPNNLNQDTVDISDTGKKLSFNMRKSSSLAGGQKAEEANPLPEWAQKADKALLKTVKIFERMHELATLAQDKKITELERADLQIEIENLRANLMAMPSNLQTGGGLTRLPNIRVSLCVGAGDYSYGDYSSVLGRMRARIANGEEWNVREAWAPEDFTRVTYNENGDEVLEAVAANAWYVVNDQNILTRREGKIVDSGRKVQTVREILESETPVIVMDAKSAAKGAKYLEKQIETVQKYREHLATNFKDMGIEGVDYFLKKLVFPDGDIGGGEPLTDPAHAGAFLFSDGIYDHRYVTRNLEESGNSDISLTDGEIIKNYMIAQGWVNKNDDVSIYGYSGPKLREEWLPDVTKPQQVKIVFSMNNSLYYASN